MAALEQSLDVPALVAKLTGAERRSRPGRRAREGADGQGAARAGRRHRDASGDRLRGEAIGQQAHRLPAGSTTSASRPAAPACRRRSSRSTAATTARPTLGIIVEYDALRGTKGAFHGDQHSAQGPVGLAAAVAIAEYLDAHAARRAASSVFGTPGEEMMPPNAKTVMHEAHVVRRRGRHRPQPRVERDVAAGARLRHLLPEHRRREVHVQRRARAPDDAVERPQRARRA